MMIVDDIQKTQSLRIMRNYYNAITEIGVMIDKEEITAEEGNALALEQDELYFKRLSSTLKT